MKLRDLYMRDDLACILPRGSIAVELGVAQGKFSAQLLRPMNISRLWSIDAWGDEERNHTLGQYLATLKLLRHFGERSTVVRARFEDVVDHFPDGHFDLVYVDGYAHEGPLGTMTQWWPKVKPGGVFAGHDYNKDEWPLVVEHVDKFVAEHKLNLHIVTEKPRVPADIPRTRRSWHPSWVTLKPGK